VTQPYSLDGPLAKPRPESQGLCVEVVCSGIVGRLSLELSRC
jgi:hypothetical protein